MKTIHRTVFGYSFLFLLVLVRTEGRLWGTTSHMIEGMIDVQKVVWT